MKYYIQRGLNEYGPYTLADLQRYLSTGNIQLSDLTRNETMTEWVPVSQVIGNIPLPAPTPPAAPAYGSTPAAATGSPYGSVPAGAAPAASPQGTVYGGPAASSEGTVYGGPAPGGPAHPGALPAYGVTAASGPVPPDFHWALVLLIGFFTCGIFFSVWLIIEALYVKKIKPQSNALLFIILAVVIPFAGGFLGGVMAGVGRGEANLIPLISTFVALVLHLIGVFTMKDNLEEHYNLAENINLRLSGVMVFFFAVFYFQHHFSRIAAWKKTGYLTPQ